MRANELMLGDWVVYNGDVDYINPVDACYEMILKLHEQKLL